MLVVDGIGYVAGAINVIQYTGADVFCHAKSGKVGAYRAIQVMHSRVGYSGWPSLAWACWCQPWFVPLIEWIVINLASPPQPCRRTSLDDLQ